MRNASPYKKILADLKAPAGWKEEHSQGNSRFYWSAEGSEGYRAECGMCGHSFNGINLANRYTSGQTVWVSGGTCWGNYIGSLGWERCTCLLCIDWHRSIRAFTMQAP